ncbi:hypothetical protein D918_07976 [Trichuris suis]|nr:hypothetical protein D918_07976 [Trichuris suis]
MYMPEKFLLRQKLVGHRLCNFQLKKHVIHLYSSSSSSELLTTAKEASMLARANILYSPFRNGLKLCQIRMCFLLSMTCAAFFFLVTTDPFSNINVHYVKRQAGDSYKKAIAQLQSLRPLLPEVKVVQRQYGKAHSFKKSAVGTGCVRPTQNINDTEIMALIRSVAPLKCASQPNWIEARNGRVILKEDAVSRNGTVRCELQPFEFVDDFTARALNRSVVRYNTTVPTDFFKIECTAADGKRYTNYHATTVAKETLNQKLERVKLPNDALNSWFIADELVKAFNERLKKEEKLCAPLRLDSILNAYVSQPKDDYVPFVGAKDTDGRLAKFRDRVGMRYDSYTLTIRTNPANAIYEATVLYDVTKRVLLIDLDSVSRRSRGVRVDEDCVLVYSSAKMTFTMAAEALPACLTGMAQ